MAGLGLYVVLQSLDVSAGWWNEGRRKDRGPWALRMWGVVQRSWLRAEPWGASAGPVPTRKELCLGIHSHTGCKLRAQTLQRKWCSNFLCYSVLSFGVCQTGKDLLLSKPPVWLFPNSWVILHQALSHLCCIILLTSQICQKFTLWLHIFRTHTLYCGCDPRPALSAVFIHAVCHLKCTILDNSSQEQYF